MALLEASTEVLGGLLRITLRLFWEIAVELVLHGTGRLLLGRGRRGDPPDDHACTLVGLLFWAVVIGLAYWLARGWA